VPRDLAYLCFFSLTIQTWGDQMKERFAEEYKYIKDVIHYLKNGNETEKKENTEKLHNRYGNFIKAMIGKKTKKEHSLKDDAYNQTCLMLFNATKLEKYKGDASFKTYIYKVIVASIRIVMPESEEAKAEKRKEKNKREREKRAQAKKDANMAGNKDQAIHDASTKQKHKKNKPNSRQYTEDDGEQNLQPTSGDRILREALEEATFTRQDNQEQLLGIKDLRAKQSQAIAVSILKMSKINPKAIRIIVMCLCDYEWEEIAECVGMDVDLVKKMYNRSDGIRDKFAVIFKETLWEKYKLDLKTLSTNFNALIDIE
jgi:DNA-directed RNA polymerase specialized sigma subunit